MLIPERAGTESPSDAIHDAIRSRLTEAGASFWPELLAAAGNPDQQVLLDALWDLVWAGEVTNDTFGPLRASRRAKRRTGASAARRPQVGRLSRLGPPAAAGRWSLVAPLLEPRPTTTEAAHALSLQLLERHGVVTREGVKSEGVAGGYAAVYPVMRALEDAGRIRRGWFVATLGAAQFALGGAVERLRAERERPESPRAWVLAATDPAQPYGAALPWPESTGRPARAAGASAVIVDGALCAYLERGARGLITFGRAGAGEPGSEPRVSEPGVAEPAVWIEAIVAAHKEGRLGALQLQRIDDGPARQSPLAPALRAGGFVDGYRGLTLRS
jgi:ATP-dependent helicase Lhr and Lhr-like helicase